MLFADLLSLHLVTFLMFSIPVHVSFFSSRCMLELNFAIYYRAASLPSLVPRLLSSFLLHTVQKTGGEGLDDLITCAMTYYAWFYAWFWVIEISQSRAHAFCISLIRS